MGKGVKAGNVYCSRDVASRAITVIVIRVIYFYYVVYSLFTFTCAMPLYPANQREHVYDALFANFTESSEKIDR